MANINSKLYLPVYEKIEKEVLELTSAIYFDDNQNSVYSIDIADILIRCCVEIESLVKELYRKEKKEEPKNPGSCLGWLDNNWKISQKKVHIISPYFHFENNISLMPFNYKNDSAEDYYSAYNAIKHDRVKNIKKASVYTMMRALAALYILNVYYEGKKIYLENDSHASKMDKTNGSKIFAFDVAPCIDEITLSSEENILAENCLYTIIRKAPDCSFAIRYINQFKEYRTVRIIHGSKAFQEALEPRVGQEMLEEDMWKELSNYIELPIEGYRKLFYTDNKVERIVSILVDRMKASYWAELNKA